MNRWFLLLAFTLILPAFCFGISVEAGFKLDNHQVTTVPGTPQSATPCVAGMAGAYPCNNVNLLAFVPVSNMGCTGNGSTVEGWVDPLNNKEYALMGCENGVSFLDVSDPVNPVYLGRLPAHNNVNSLWRDIRVYSNRAYVGSEASGHGIQVFDLTRLRGVSTPQLFTEDARYGGLGNSHTIFINQNTGFLYAVGSGGGGNVCPSGLHMINVQSLAPTFAGCFGSGVYTHETTCYTYNGPDSTYTGHELCFSANGPTERLVIVDVTNKSAPVQVSTTPYPGSGYPHQVWLTEDQKYLLLNDEFDESTFAVNTTTYLWDISNLDAPVLIDNFVHATHSIDHNLYVKGNLVFESNYEAGLRILDLASIASGTLNEVGFFDVWPYGDAAQFEGTWDNYPYLPSGIVLVTGIFNPDPPNPPNVAGMFILQPVLGPNFHFTAPTTNIPACGTGAGQGTVQLVPENSYSGNVSLSTLGLPGGASALFTPNPVAVPGSSTINITLSGTPAGNYPFKVHGSDGTISHDFDMTLNVASTVPSAPSLMNPPNGSPAEPFVVHYEWNLVAGASSYDLDVSTTSDFTNIIYTANIVNEDHHTGTLALQPVTTYYWRVRANNACGASSNSVTFQFTTRAPAQVLIVDDDDNDPDAVTNYVTALTALGKTYDIWNTAIQAIHQPRHLDEPDATLLARYDVVIWASGDASGGVLSPKAGPNESSETSLSVYLNGGGCLLLSSQEYFNDRGSVVNTFMSNYLGIGSVDNNVSHANATGKNVFAGLGLYTLIFPSGFVNRTDRVNPAIAPGVQLAFSGSAGNAGITHDGGAYRTIFLGFPYEVISNSTGRRNVMQRALEFCDGLQPPTCPAITVSPVSLPGGTMGFSYSQNVTASGGTGPYTFTSTALPSGLTLSAAGVLSGTPDTAGNFNFTVTATDTAACAGTRNYTLNIAAGCLFCDDFNDGVNPAWTFGKGVWQEASGSLNGTHSGKTTAIATPVFSGCSQCTVTTMMKTAGGTGNRISLLGWYVDKKTNVELMMKEQNDRWIFKQKSNGAVVAKTKATGTIVPGVTYDVRIAFDGINFTVFVDNVLLMTVPSGANPNGSVGFQVKATTGTFDEINVN